MQCTTELASFTAPAQTEVNHAYISIEQCKPGDVIAIRLYKCSKRLAEANLEFPGLANVPSHLELDKSKLSAKVTARCEREWVALEINELLVVEYYSRRSDCQTVTGCSS